jgi:glutathione S-transferase
LRRDRLAIGSIIRSKLVFGDAFSVGDIPAAATALDIHHPDLPNVLRWYDLMRERPPFRRIVMMPLS